MRDREPIHTPKNILKWVQEDRTSDDINLLLQQCRKENLSHHFNQRDIAGAICYALTSHNVNGFHVNKHHLRKALDKFTNSETRTKDALPGSDIIMLITEAIKLIMMIIEWSRDCKKTKNLNEITELLRTSDNNPFLNLPKVKLHLDLHDAKLRYVNFEKADLSNSNLSGADLFQANLNGANLSNTDLTGAALNLAALRWANLSGAKMDPVDFDQVGLCNFIQNNYPTNIQLKTLPSKSEIDAVLQYLHDVTEAEDYAELKTGNRIKRIHERHHQRQIVANNIVKISHMIADKNLRHDFLESYYNNEYFKDHTSARLAGGANSVLLHTSHLFGRKNNDPIIGNSAQNIIRNEMRACHPEPRAKLLLVR